MSWIAELADKAENILNKIDQNAASALQIPPTLDVSKSLTTEESNPDIHSTDLSVESITIDLGSDTITNLSQTNSINTEQESTILDVKNDEENSCNSKDDEYSVLKNKLESLEKILQQNLDESDLLKTALYEAQETNKRYSQSVFELETHLFKLKQDYQEILEKLDMRTKENQKQMYDFQEYKKKAQSALIAKDNLIAEIKLTEKLGKHTDPAFLPMDSNQLRCELSALNDKLNESLQKNHCLNNELECMRNELSAEKENNHDKLEALRSELRVQKERNVQLESDSRVSNEKIKSLHQQMANQMAELATRLQEKDRIIEQLNFSQDFKSQFSTNAESRLKNLTLALVDKQNALESITVERNALKLQLEKAQDELEKVTLSNSRSSIMQNSLTYNANTTDDIKAQFPLLMKENPFDNRVARRVKRAYSTLDSAGIRLGVFLRRYPLIRIFVLIYIGLLHMWVFVVLLSSTPTT